MKEGNLAQLFQEQEDSEWTVGENIYHIHRNTILDEQALSGYAILLFDITRERKQLEHMQLLKEEADTANHAKSSFLANMSHEIRTPINAIFGMNEMILRQSHEPETKKYAFDVKNAVKTLLSIINDILDSSKIESGKMELVPAEYELGRILSDVFNMTAVKAQDKHLSLMFDISPELPSVLWGDDIRIRQILLNLLSNGVKYTQEGVVSLELRGEVKDNLAELRFCVKDTGIGMKEEDLPRLFEAFERVDINRNRNIEGTGLGMKITAALLKMMDSKIEVESEYGKGSQFSFVLRQKVIDSQPIGNFEQAGQQMAEEYTYNVSFMAPDAKVLVVDDSQVNRTVLRYLLKDTKKQVVDADSGKACLDLVSKEKYSLIFMDDMMPDMNGRETLENMHLLEHNLCKDTPVIMLTANAILGAKDTYMELGFSDFLTKPIDPVKLEAMLGRLLPSKYVFWNEAGVSENKIELSGKKHLPEIEGVDWEYAGCHLPNDNLLLETAVQFLKSISKEIETLQYLIENIEAEDHLNLYRIRVHTIKSSAAILGIISLAGISGILEKTARANDVERLKTLHPIIVDELKLYQERLPVLIHNEEEKEAADLQIVLPYIKMLKSTLTERDYDSSDSLMEKLNNYSYDEEVQKQINLLQSQVTNLEADAACDTIKGILLCWESE